MSTRSRSRGFKWSVTTAAAALAVVTLGVGQGAAAPNPAASCVGLTVQFTSKNLPTGSVAELTRLFHQQAKDAGIPPGAGDAALAKLHAGDPFLCF
jgi:hypothetical protein